MTVHELKCWPEFYQAIFHGRKTFEIRERRDRDFKVGDVLNLQEWNPTTELYTGHDLMAKVVYMTDFAQKPDHVVMGIKVL